MLCYRKKNIRSKEGKRMQNRGEEELYKKLHILAPYRKNYIYWRMRRSMMWRVHPAVFHEEDRRDFWGIPAHQGSVTALPQMEDVFLF